VSEFPSAPLVALDTLWLQVAGTLCNLACTHCFISCSPTNHAHGMLTLAEVDARIAEAEALGVKEYYVTGG
jgi:MoaA/NifB/PqqE/SkfB family radical SAM enzyme